MVRYGRAKRCTESRPRNERDRERANRDRGYFRRSGCTCFWKRQIPSTSSKFCLINNGHLFLFLARARVFQARPLLARASNVLRALDETNTIRTKRPAQFSCPTHLSDLASSTPVWRFQFRLVPVQENNTRRQTFDPAGPLRVKTDRTGQSVHKMLQVNKFKISSPSPCVCV